MKDHKVAVVMGSDSDLEVMLEAVKVLESFQIRWEVFVSSAHRTPNQTTTLAKNAEKEGFDVIIAGAGAAAHLAGVLASHTTLPVIGVPIPSSSIKGLDALLSTVQMPGGIPVATMSIGKAGAKNAALFAVEMLAAKDKRLKKLLNDYRKDMARLVEEKNRKVKDEIFKRLGL